MTAKTPWVLSRDAFEWPIICDSSETVRAECYTDDDANLIIAAVNVYESLPEWIRGLKPSTVATCVETMGLDAIAALEAEETET